MEKWAFMEIITVGRRSGSMANDAHRNILARWNMFHSGLEIMGRADKIADKKRTEVIKDKCSLPVL